MLGIVPDPVCIVPKSFLFLGRRNAMVFFCRNVFGHYEAVDRAVFRALFRALFKVLPGPPKYLPHQCPHRVRLVPEIVPDPPLHSAQILAFTKKDFYFFLAEMYLGTMKGWIGRYCGLYSGSTKVLPGPPKVPS